MASFTNRSCVDLAFYTCLLAAGALGNASHRRCVFWVDLNDSSIVGC